MRPVVAEITYPDGSDWVCGTVRSLSMPPFGLPSYLRVDFRAGSEEEARLRLSATGLSMSDQPVSATENARFYSTKETGR